MARYLIEEEDLKEFARQAYKQGAVDGVHMSHDIGVKRKTAPRTFSDMVGMLEQDFHAWFRNQDLPGAPLYGGC